MTTVREATDGVERGAQRATRPVPQVTAEVVSRRPNLQPYQEDWERLYRECATEPSTSFEWSDALTRSHLRPRDQFVLIRMSRGLELLGLIPLVTRRLTLFGCPVTSLSPLADGHNTHSDLLLRSADADTVQAFFSAVLALDLGWDVFRMSRVRDDHPLLRHAEASARALAGVMD